MIPSKHYADFHVAGTKYWDAALVLDQMRPGMPVALCAEPDNSADPNAVAILFNGTKIGYIPREENSLVAQLLRFGHHDVLEGRILKVDPREETWKQIRVGLYFVDKTNAQ